MEYDCNTIYWKFIQALIWSDIPLSYMAFRPPFDPSAIRKLLTEILAILLFTSYNYLP